MSTDLRYPTGRFTRPSTTAPDDLREAISTLAGAPELLREAVSGLTPEQLGTPYRPEGWTVLQVVHHVADSHMNAAVRIRLALTEDWPTIKLYDEKAWALLPDVQAPIEWSLDLLEGLHARWVMLLVALDEAQWRRGYLHPESGATTVEMATLLYAWHSRHHIAHITSLRGREGW